MAKGLEMDDSVGGEAIGGIGMSWLMPPGCTTREVVHGCSRVHRGHGGMEVEEEMLGCRYWEEE